MKTCEEVMKAIEEMDNGERIKLLEKLYDKHFDNRPSEEVMEAFREWYDEHYEGGRDNEKTTS